MTIIKSITLFCADVHFHTLGSFSRCLLVLIDFPQGCNQDSGVSGYNGSINPVRIISWKRSCCRWRSLGHLEDFYLFWISLTRCGFNVVSQLHSITKPESFFSVTESLREEKSMHTMKCWFRHFYVRSILYWNNEEQGQLTIGDFVIFISYISCKISNDLFSNPSESRYSHFGNHWPE